MSRKDNELKKNGGERIQIIESELQWVGDRGGVGIDGKVKAQGGRRVGAIKGGGYEAKSVVVWVNESDGLRSWGGSGEAVAMWLCGCVGESD